MTNKEKAQLALNHHLYVDGWLLERYLQRIIKYGVQHSAKVRLHWDEEKNIPVGVCLIIKTKHLASNGSRIITGMVFVKEEYRRRGIGTKLFEGCNDFMGDGGGDGFAGFVDSLAAGRTIYFNRRISYASFRKANCDMGFKSDKF